MSRKETTIILIAALAVLIVGAGCFFGGRQTVQAAWQAERFLNVLLNRSDLAALNGAEGPIYVTGHQSPDSDTIGSSIAYATLLRQLGYDAQAVRLGDLNNETLTILGAAGVPIPPLLEDASGCNMILMDHSEYIQSAAGLQDAKVLTIVDHHGDGNVVTGNQLVYDARPLGSTATIVFIRYRNYGLVPDKASAMMMLGAILSDTVNLKSTTTTPADMAAAKILKGITGIKDTDAFYADMYKASLSYGDRIDEDIFFSDYKNYTAAGKTYGIGVINVYDETDARAMTARLKDIVPASLSKEGTDMAWAQISIFHDDVSVTYLVPSGEAAREVIETAFGDKAVFDGTAFRLEPGISHKQVLVPAITEVLEGFPHE